VQPLSAITTEMDQVHSPDVIVEHRQWRHPGGGSGNVDNDGPRI